MTALVSFFVALLLSLLGSGPAPGPAPAPHGVRAAPAVPAPAAVAPSPAASLPRPGGFSGEARTPATTAPTVAAAPSPDPANTQLPDEVIGRQVECPDGSVGQIVAADLSTDCRP